MSTVATRVILNNAGDQMIQAVYKVFGVDCVELEGLVYDHARETSSEYDGGSWAFVTNADATVGFWYPLDKETYKVSCAENYFDHDAMQAMAFGAACTFVKLRWLMYRVHSTGKDGERVRRLANLADSLRDFVYDLSEDSQLDGRAFSGFTD